MSRVWRDGWGIFRESPILFVAIVLAGNLAGAGGNWAIRKIPIGLSIATKSLLIAVALLCLFLLFAVTQALISLTVFHRYNQQPDILQADWQGAISRAVPLVLTMLCMGALVALGFVALIIPGFIVLTIYAVTMPVCAVEGTGPGASLTRSAALTRGHRWPIFAVMIEFAIVCVLLEALVAGLWTELFGLPLNSQGLALVQSLVTLIPSAYFAVTLAIIYCHLREFERGGPLVPSKTSDPA